jgi:hypothetical protein
MEVSNIHLGSCKCKNMYTYVILCSNVKQSKKSDFYLGREEDFIMFL